MVETILISVLVWAFYRYRTVNIIVTTLLFIFSVVGLLILLRIGFISVFFETILEIPVMFFKGLFGVIHHLLFD